MSIYCSRVSAKASTGLSQHRSACSGPSWSLRRALKQGPFGRLSGLSGLSGWCAAGLFALAALFAPGLAHAEELPTLPLTVNVNTADARTIANVLQGVGLRRAAAIVAYREKHGAFKNPESLSEVKGVGARTVELNATRILVTD